MCEQFTLYSPLFLTYSYCYLILITLLTLILIIICLLHSYLVMVVTRKNSNNLFEYSDSVHVRS